MNCIGVICKPDLDHVGRELKKLDLYLVNRGLKVLYDEHTSPLWGPGGRTVIDRRSMVAGVDLLIVLGGDGTILGAARAAAGRNIPILGVNLGKLGFLAEFSPSDLYHYLDDILDGKYKLDHRTMLRAQVFRKGERVAEYLALNELSLNKEAIARVICLRTTINGNFLNDFTADGIIVATPTGSTAYSLSSGGPIVQPGLQALLIAPICPHTLSNRPLIVPETSVVELELVSSSARVFLTMDGQTGETIFQGDLIRVGKSKNRVSLICHPKIDYYTMLRRKLGWGVSGSK